MSLLASIHLLGHVATFGSRKISSVGNSFRISRHHFLLVSLCICFGDMSMDMKAFLETVKGAEVQGRVDKALAILTRVEILSPEDFVDTTKRPH